MFQSKLSEKHGSNVLYKAIRGRKQRRKGRKEVRSAEGRKEGSKEGGSNLRVNAENEKA
jgi:hypothetical protein